MGCEITGGSSTSDKYGIDIDQYSRNIRITGRTFTTPTTTAINTVLNCDTVFVNDCTIDAPSTAKSINDVAGANYLRPRYQIENWTNGPVDGQYWANQSIQKSSATYRTTPPCWQFTFKSTMAIQVSPIKLMSFKATSGTGYTVSVYIKANAGWAGTIVPILRLNGKTITTGATISSLTTSWVQYSYTANSGDVTSNGELSFEIIPNSTTHAFYFDDFTIT
jgi:hypothetical protein